MHPLDRPLGPREFDFGRMSPEQFEEMCFQIARLETPDIERLAPPDGGLDFLQRQGVRVRRGWQAKRYTGQISWPACRQSLERAIEVHAPAHMTFCFARDLTVSQQKLFDKHLQLPHPRIRIDYWGSSELTARLNVSDAAERIARHFFSDAASDARDIALAIRASGDLNTSQDALERQAAIGAFFKAHDPYFSYQSSQREMGSAEPPLPEGTAVSFERIGDGLVQRIAALPRQGDAIDRYGPSGRLVFDGPAGSAALDRFRGFLAEGGAIELDEGVSFTLDRLPPGLSEFVDLGTPITGRVRVSSPPALPLACRFTSESTLGDAELTIDMVPGDPPPEWAHARYGKHGGLQVDLAVRPHDKGGQASLNWRYTMDDSSVATQRDVLRFLRSLQGTGTLSIRNRATDAELLPPFALTESDEPDDMLADTLSLFEDLATVEARSGEALQVPDEVSANAANTIAYTAHWIRAGTVPATVDSFSLVLPPEKLSELASGRELSIREEAYLRLFGREIHLGTRELVLSHMRIVSTEPDKDGLLRVTMVPATENARHVEVRLLPPAESVGS